MSNTVPAAQLPKAVIKRGDEQTRAPAKVTRLALHGWTLKKQIDNLKTQLDGVNKSLINTLGPGATVLVDSEVQVPIAERQTITVENDPALFELLGAQRWEDLVTEKTTYTPTDKLKAMVADGDDEVGMAAREHMAIKTSVSVSYRGGKPLPPNTSAKKAA